jgi:hypothetical protein
LCLCQNLLKKNYVLTELRTVPTIMCTDVSADLICLECVATSSYALSTKDRWGHFNFMNSRFHLHEFPSSSSWIPEFIFMHSWFQLHEFMISTSRIGYREFVKFKWRICEVEIVNSWSWSREFVKLKWGIHNAVSWIREFRILETWIHEDRIVNSWRWYREFMKLKWTYRSFVVKLGVLPLIKLYVFPTWEPHFMSNSSIHTYTFI